MDVLFHFLAIKHHYVKTFLYNGQRDVKSLVICPHRKRPEFFFSRWSLEYIRNHASISLLVLPNIIIIDKQECLIHIRVSISISIQIENFQPLIQFILNLFKCKFGISL